jgi:hypothetical protein
MHANLKLHESNLQKVAFVNMLTCVENPWCAHVWVKRLFTNFSNFQNWIRLFLQSHRYINMHMLVCKLMKSSHIMLKNKIAQTLGNVCKYKPYSGKNWIFFFLCVLHDKLLKSMLLEIDSKGVNCNMVKECLLQWNTLNPKNWMLEAHAHMHLWNIIIEDNVDVAIHLMFELFISTQKFGVLIFLQKVRDRSIIFRLNQLGDLIIMTM